MSGPTIEASVTVDDSSANPVDLLAATSALSKSKIKRAMTLGAVWITKGSKTKRLRRAKAKLQQGDKLSIYYDEKVLSLEPTPPTLIANESVYSVWYKPAGLLASGSKFGDHCAINRWVELNVKPQKPVFIVHRLDRFATGLILLAHTKQAAAELSRQFRDRQVRKIYQVIVEGLVEAAQTVELSLDGKEAVSEIKPLATNNTQSKVEVDIKTGRKHQIRRHLAAIGHPVIGDRQYGNTLTGELQLTACELDFLHPQTQEPQHYVLTEALRPYL